MLYLIRSWGKKNSILKIGFTSNVQKRMENYYHSNPFFQKISLREGELYEEKLIQLYTTLMGYKYKILDEWFIDCPEVISIFHKPISKMKKTLWKHRDEIFKIEDFKKGSDKRIREIFEDLKKTYGKKGKFTTKIDSDYGFLVAQETLKKMKSDDYFFY